MFNNSNSITGTIAANLTLNVETSEGTATCTYNKTFVGEEYFDTVFEDERLLIECSKD